MDPRVAPELYRNIKPVFLGMSLELIQKLLRHPNLMQTLDFIKENGDASALFVTHNAEEIESVTKEIRDAAKHQWWEVLLGWSPNTTGVLKLMLHPIIVILLLQALLLCLSIGICIWTRKRFL